MLSKSCDLLSRQYRFEGHNFGTPVLYAALAVAIASLGYKRKKHGNSAVDLRVHSLVWNRMRLFCPVLQPIRHIFVAISSITFLFHALFFSTNFAGNIFTSAATLCDSFGKYELAERLFRLNPWRDRYWSSSAVWRVSSAPETDKQREERNLAVSTIYGAESAEMARRYKFLGDNLQRPKTFNASQIDHFYLKAQELYHKIRRHGRCAEILIER
jgi:hypothetical protein